MLSARLLLQPSCGQVKIVQQIYIFGHVALWLCEDITACCYTYCYFRNTTESEVHWAVSASLFIIAMVTSGYSCLFISQCASLIISKLCKVMF